MEEKRTSKVSPIYYQGLKIIRVSDLPNEQAHLFSGWIKPELFVHLSDSQDHDCVTYDDYEYWFQNYFVVEKDLNYLI